jgi:hypothetical protein
MFMRIKLYEPVYIHILYDVHTKHEEIMAPLNYQPNMRLYSAVDHLMPRSYTTEIWYISLQCTYSLGPNTLHEQKFIIKLVIVEFKNNVRKFSFSFSSFRRGSDDNLCENISVS